MLLVEHGPGLTVSRDLHKLGYRAVESCELSFEDYRAVSHFLSVHCSCRVRLRRTVRWAGPPRPLRGGRTLVRGAGDGYRTAHDVPG